MFYRANVGDFAVCDGTHLRSCERNEFDFVACAALMDENDCAMGGNIVGTYGG